VRQGCGQHGCRGNPNRFIADHPDEMIAALDMMLLHPRRWPAYYAERKGEAAAALTAIGMAMPIESPDDFEKKGGEWWVVSDRDGLGIDLDRRPRRAGQRVERRGRRWPRRRRPRRRGVGQGNDCRFPNEGE
jgi:hypothetical protein